MGIDYQGIMQDLGADDLHLENIDVAGSSTKSRMQRIKEDHEDGKDPERLFESYISSQMVQAGEDPTTHDHEERHEAAAALSRREIELTKAAKKLKIEGASISWGVERLEEAIANAEENN